MDRHERPFGALGDHGWLWEAVNGCSMGHLRQKHAVQELAICSEVEVAIGWQPIGCANQAARNVSPEIDPISRAGQAA